MESSALHFRQGRGAEDDQEETTQSFGELQGEGSGGRRARGPNPGELAEHFDVHPNQIQDWKKKLVANAEMLFGNGGSSAGAENAERKTQKLHAMIGQLTLEKDFLSKALGRDR